MTISINNWQNVKIGSACQEEAINEGHGPQVNRISGKAVSIRRHLRTQVYAREGNGCGEDPFQTSQSINQQSNISQQVG